MTTIDYIYRFDPKNPSLKPLPHDAEAARRALENGNRMFASWMESCRTSDLSTGETRYVVQCNGVEMGMNRVLGQIPKQAPFAVVVGCSDARVPTELLFGQGFNDLFIIRVAGNVLGDVCMGSIEFAMNALSDSVKCIVVLGHLGCGAVTGAVDTYLQPLKFWSKSNPPMLRTITQRIFVAVREAANGLKESWGAEAASMPGYREALVDIAVCVNAAQAAFDLRLEVERAAKWEIEVLYGVLSLHNHQVSMPVNPRADSSGQRQSRLRTDQPQGVCRNRQPHGRFAQAGALGAWELSRESSREGGSGPWRGEGVRRPRRSPRRSTRDHRVARVSEQDHSTPRGRAGEPMRARLHSRVTFARSRPRPSWCGSCPARSTGCRGPPSRSPARPRGRLALASVLRGRSSWNQST